MLAYLDDLDSKIEAMQRLIAEPHTVGDWSRISPMFERPIYRRRTIEGDSPEEAAVAAAGLSQSEGAKVQILRSTARPDSFNTPFEQLSELFKDQS
jgi:hypothetical protein